MFGRWARGNGPRSNPIRSADPEQVCLPCGAANLGGVNPGGEWVSPTLLAVSVVCGRVWAMTIRVRPAARNDLDEVVMLWAGNAGPTKLAGGHTDALRLIERDRDALLVAESGGSIVGAVIVGFDGWRCHLYRMAVRDSQRRSGIGSQLFAASLARARALGATRIDAMVDESNMSAIAFWESVGFKLDLDDRRWSLFT